MMALRTNDLLSQPQECPQLATPRRDLKACKSS
jgi:hypothetical protein